MVLHVHCPEAGHEIAPDQQREAHCSLIGQHLFLDLSYNEAKADGKLRTHAELDEAIIHGAVKRARPKMMTVAAAFMGLLPIMWSTSAGADVMKRIAAPMIGGLVTSFFLELLVYPAIYKVWKQREIGNAQNHGKEDKQPTNGKGKR